MKGEGEITAVRKECKFTVKYRTQVAFFLYKHFTKHGSVEVNSYSRAFFSAFLKTQSNYVVTSVKKKDR
jgi:hypothetical protein